MSRISLRPIDDLNRSGVLGLRVTTAQENFVNNVPEALFEAAEEPGGRAIYWELIIDQRYQRRGYGTAALDLVVEYFRGRPGVEEIWTSAGEGDGGPIPFYERYGFERTGEIVFDNEVLLRLPLT